MSMFFQSFLQPLVSHLGLFVLLTCCFPAFGWAQGSWTPANADASFPRTLIKTSEIPDLHNYLLQSEPNQMFQLLWNDLQGYNLPSTLTSNGSRRRAAFIAKNAAFFHLIDRKPDNGGITPLSSTESLDLRDFAIEVLEAMVADVEPYPNFNEYLWRSNELTNNVIAYDLLKGAGVPDSLLQSSRDLLVDYAGQLYGEAEFDFLGLGFLSLHVDNHALRTCGALGLAAVVLSDENNSNSDRQARNWLDLAMYNIDNVFWKSSKRQSETGTLGGYSEGPHYLRFGSKHILPFFHAMGNFLPDSTLAITYKGSTRNIRNPWFDDNYDRLFQWILRIAMPDGRSPALEDSFVATAWEELAIWEKPELCPRVDYSRWAHVQPGSLWRMLHHSSDDVVADYLASMTADQPDTFELLQVLPESGNVVFRNGWDSTSTYLHLTAKNGRARNSAQGHNQSDPSSFILHSHGELLALDAGYLKWDRRGEVGEAENHNLILVDGDGPANGSTASANGADAFAERPIRLNALQYAEVRTAYLGTDITRKTMMLRGKHFIMADDIESNSPHDYTYQLHGYGLENGDSLTGTFDDLFNFNDGQALYEKGGVSLLATITADGGIDTYSKAPQPHEWFYDSVQTHTAFYGTVENRSDATILTSLFPYTGTAPQVSQLCNPSCGTILVTDDGYREVFSALGHVPGIATGLTYGLTGDGELFSYGEDPNGDFHHLLLEEGSELDYGPIALCSTSVVTDFAMEQTDTATYTAFIRDGGTVWLQGLRFEPLSVNGIPVSNWNFDIPTMTLEVNLAGGGYFTIHEGVVVGVDQPKPTLLQLSPNPANSRVEIITAETGGELQIWDLHGRILKRKAVNSTDTQLDLDDLTSGVYLIKWERNGHPTQQKKLVKQ